MTDKIVKSDEEWRAQLSADEFSVARQGGTERAFTGRYWDEKTPGIYHCVCCDTPLFSSDTKYDSGSGWPSFYDSLDNNAVSTRTDNSHGMVRVEALCARCDAHLGHVFEGERLTEKNTRHCVNSISMSFVPAGEDLPAVIRG